MIRSPASVIPAETASAGLRYGLEKPELESQRLRNSLSTLSKFVQPRPGCWFGRDLWEASRVQEGTPNHQLILSRDDLQTEENTRDALRPGDFGRRRGR